MSLFELNLGLASWSYADFFSPPTGLGLHPIIKEVENYILNIKLENHEFFIEASHNKAALRIWMTQELVMTNAFSQIVLNSASKIKNVHERSMLTEVAFGEHGIARNGFAKRSHPWLLNLMRESSGLDVVEVYPLNSTVNFIQRLHEGCGTALSAVAYIGVGNERMIIPEYTAIIKCFDEQWPEVNYEPFLAANLKADIGHSELCYQLASIFIAKGSSAEEFYQYATASVDSRYQYFSDLLVEHHNSTHNIQFNPDGRFAPAG